MAISELKITECYSTTSTTSKPNRSIDYIILHYTAGVTSKSGSAVNIAKWFGNGANPSNPASSDFQIDDTTIVQYNKDLANRYTWCCGGSTNYPKTNSLSGIWKGKATNANTINIEICSNKKNTKSLQATDTDWYFTDAELELTAKLVRYLMYVFDIPLERVGTHNSCTGKSCPAMWTQNESCLKGYYDFLERVKNTPIPTTINGGNFPTPKGNQNAVLTVPKPITPTTTTTTTSSSLPYKVKIKDDELNVRADAGTNNKVVTTVKKGDVYTIVAEKTVNGAKWGKLKSGIGWMNVSEKYCTKV